MKCNPGHVRNVYPLLEFSATQDPLPSGFNAKRLQPTSAWTSAELPSNEMWYNTASLSEPCSTGWWESVKSLQVVKSHEQLHSWGVNIFPSVFVLVIHHTWKGSEKVQQATSASCFCNGLLPKRQTALKRKPQTSSSYQVRLVQYNGSMNGFT